MVEKSLNCQKKGKKEAVTGQELSKSLLNVIMNGQKMVKKKENFKNVSTGLKYNADFTKLFKFCLKTFKFTHLRSQKALNISKDAKFSFFLTQKKRSHHTSNSF